MEPVDKTNKSAVNNYTNVDKSTRTTNVNNVVNNISNTTIVQQPKPSAAERAISIIRLQSSHQKFVGRERELKELKEWFLGGEWVHRQAGKAALLHGLGGMGKTELALRFANTWQSEFSFVYTIPAESAETRAEAYRQLATQLGVFLEEKSTPDQVRNRLFAHLEGASFGKPYLLFYDNVEEELEFPTRNGHLLITARNQKFAPKDLDVRKFELELMEEHEGLNLLKEWTGEEKSPEMKELFRRLGGYPLVLAQVGGHIGSNPLRTVAKYLENHTVPQTAEDRYQQTLDQVLGVTLQALQDEAPLAFEWLQICAYLNPDNIPLDYLERHLASKETREQLVLDLTNRSLMHFESETFSMHRHIQEALQKMDTEGETLKKASSLIAGIRYGFIIFDDFATLQSESTLWASHAEQLLKLDLSPVDQIQLLIQLGEFEEFILCQYEKSLSHHQKALALARKVHPQEHPQVADSLYGIGYALDYLGRDEEALRHHLEALAIRKKVYQKGHLDVSIAHCDVGNVLQHLFRYEEALEHYQQALAIDKKLYGDEHPHVSISLCNIGSAFNYLRRYEDALKHHQQSLALHQQSLALRKKVYVGQHPGIATAMGWIGEDLLGLGRHEKALEYQQQALAILKKIYGDVHPHIACSFRSIGHTFEGLGKYDEALKHYQQCLAIEKEVYGEKHSSIARTLFDLGYTFKKMENLKEAKSYFAQAVAIGEEVLPTDHSDLKAYREWLAAVGRESKPKEPATSNDKEKCSVM